MFESTFQLKEENDGRATRIRVIAESNFFTDEKSKPVKITNLTEILNRIKKNPINVEDLL